MPLLPAINFSFSSFLCLKLLVCLVTRVRLNHRLPGSWHLKAEALCGERGMAQCVRKGGRIRPQVNDSKSVLVSTAFRNGTKYFLGCVAELIEPLL